MLLLVIHIVILGDINVTKPSPVYSIHTQLYTVAIVLSGISLIFQLPPSIYELTVARV